MQTDALRDVMKDVDRNKDAQLEKLKEFLRIPSVSTKPEHEGDCRRCADWLGEQLRSMRLNVEVAETGGHPCVVAKNDHKRGRPTVLVYGHYDVQPPEPLDLWKTPPFEPTVRDGAIYARGTADDKGQVWCHVAAVQAWQELGGLPVNVTLLIEGEEEIGSVNLKEFVKKRAEDFKADIAVVSDTNQFAKGLPAITYGLRGLAYMEVFVTGPGHDLHSGLYGGAVPNPANALVEMLATLHDADGRVTVPGFYDDVLDLSREERDMWKALPFDENRFKSELKLTETYGEKGFTTLERKWARPTCDINGLTSGYQGKGAKTVIASQASAKVSMRLVPNQDGAKIAAAFTKALQDRAPRGVKVEVVTHSHTNPVLVSREGAAMRAAQAALEKGFGKKPTLMREGGSIPVVSLIKNVLGIDTLLVGFGLDDDRIHSPNEKFDLDGLFGGMRTSAALFDELSRTKF